MTEKPLVSVIINCYNSEKYLGETIDSLIAQTYVNWEAIFWDNCSTDKTAEIIASYSEPRFQYFRAEKNTPLGEARNLAMEKVHGELMCFLDSDDVWMDNFLYNGVFLLSKHTDIAAFYSNYYLWRLNERIPYNKDLKTGIHSFETILKTYGIGMSGCIVRSSIVKNFSISFDPRFQLIEDLDFFLKVADKGNFYYANECLFLYRMYSNSTSNLLANKWASEYHILYEELVKQYIDNNPPKLRIEDLKRIHYYEIIWKMRNCKDEGKRKELMTIIWHNIKIARKNPIYIVYVLLGPSLYGFLGRLRRT